MHQELQVTAHSHSPLAELGASTSPVILVAQEHCLPICIEQQSLVPAHVFFKRQAVASRAQFKLGSKGTRLPGMDAYRLEISKPCSYSLRKAT